jgi:hypothetical protein
MPDKIWIKDFSILFDQTRWYEFWPSAIQTSEERINSFVRLAFYSSILLSLYHTNTKYMFIFIFVLLFTFMIYKGHPDMNPEHPKSLAKQIEEKTIQKLNSPENNTVLNNFTPNIGIIPGGKFSSNIVENTPTIENLENTDNTQRIYPETCIKPTVENPFMNYNYTNFDKDGNLIDTQGCDPNDPVIKKMIDEKFNNNLFKDTSDLFGKNNSQRQFYTNVNTGITNDRESFAKWLYLNPKTCKEDQSMCSNQNFEDLRSNRYIFPDDTQNPVNNSAKLR